IVSLEERFKKQESEIDAAQKKVDDLRSQLQIPDAVDKFDSPAVLLLPETLRRIESQGLEAKADLVKQEALLNQLKNLSQDELVQAIPTRVQDPMINSLIETRTKAEQSLVTKSNQFGPENEEVRKLKSQIADLNVKIQKRADGIKLSLTTRVEALKSGL